MRTFTYNKISERGFTLDTQKIIQLIETNPHVYQILKNCPYQILKKWSISTYKSGELILRQGETVNTFYIIVEGEADIYMMSEGGKKYSQAVYQNGDFIGELEIFDHSASVCFVEAISDMTLIGLQVDDFHKWLQLDSYMSQFFNRALAKYYYNLSKKAGMDRLYSLKYRLSEYLIQYLPPLIDDRKSINVKVNKGQISDQLAVTSRSINRILQEWKEKNIIEIENDSIIIKNLSLLLKERENSMQE